MIQTFVNAQLGQIEKWLLEPRMYAVVLALTAISIFIGIERLDRRYWLHTLTDYFYGVMYTIFYFPLIITMLVYLKWATDTWTPWLNMGLSAHLPLILQFLVVVLLDDFLSYVSHYIRHKVRPLWYFHIIHHSQERLNPLTTKRFHPLENLFSKAVIKWVPLAIVGGSLEMWITYYLIDAVWDYFIHSNLRINFGPLRYVFVSPQYHRIHHSRLPEHFDKNFSDRFVIWDLLFGTAHLNADEYPPTGLHDIEFPLERSCEPSKILWFHLQHLWFPFRMIYRDMRKASPTYLG